MKNLNVAILFICSFFILQGCSVTNIPLKNIENTTQQAPLVSSASVVIVMFEDKRGIDSIGITNDGTEIVPRGDITQWVTNNLASFLQQSGYRVSIAPSKSDAMKVESKYIISGSIDSVHLDASVFSSTASIKMTIRTESSTGVRTEESVSASNSAINNPFGSTEADVILEALLQIYTDILPLLKK